MRADLVSMYASGEAIAATVIPRAVLSRCRLMNVLRAGMNASSSDEKDFSFQRIKLIGKRPLITAFHYELTLANHVHQLDASQYTFGRSK